MARARGADLMIRMSSLLATSGAVPDATDALHAVRRRVLQASLNLLAVGVPFFAVFLFVQAVRADTLTRTVVVLSAYTLAFPALRLASGRLGFRASAHLLLALTLLTAFVIGAYGGITVANTALILLVVLLGTLFFGRRGAALALIAGVAVMATIGVLTVNEPWPSPATFWNVRTASFWARQTLVLALFGVAFALVELYVLERLVAEAAALQRAAEREHDQRIALEEAQREREAERVRRTEAEHALEESRRIEALARLAGGIAHDFNNALTVIIGAVDLARTTLPAESQLGPTLDQVAEAANGAADLTHQLLMLGRREVGTLQPVAMGQLLRRLEETFRRVLPADIDLLVDIVDADLVVFVDPAQLERALFNLVLNARDAMPAGGSLSIVCRGEAAAGRPDRLPDGRYIVLGVADTGDGMDTETRDRAFEPFFTTKAAGKGTGLGLAMVHAFVAEAGGAIEVASTVGVGTTFTLLLPPFSEAVHLAPKTAVAAPPAVRPLGGRVLVVEDNAAVRGLMKKVLSANGFVVAEAADGDEAMGMLAQRTDYALMCIDAVMPGASAASVIAHATKVAPDMRVLVCSGYVSEDLVRRGVAEGQYAFLGKPFSAQQLMAAIQAALVQTVSTPTS